MRTRKRKRVASGKATPQLELSTVLFTETCATGKAEAREGHGADVAHPLVAAGWFTAMKAIVANGLDAEQVRVIIRADRGAV